MDAKQQFNKVMDELETSHLPLIKYFKDRKIRDIVCTYQYMLKQQFGEGVLGYLTPDEINIDEYNECVYHISVSKDMLFSYTVFHTKDYDDSLKNVLCNVVDYFCRSNKIIPHFIADYITGTEVVLERYFVKNEGCSECPVCLEKFNKKGRKKQQLPCGHHLCKGCLNTLKECDRCPQCPQCRKFISNLDIMAEHIVNEVEKGRTFHDLIPLPYRWDFVEGYIRFRRIVKQPVNNLYELFNPEFYHYNEWDDTVIIFTEKINYYKIKPKH
jgi:hypothetical protein